MAISRSGKAAVMERLRTNCADNQTAYFVNFQACSCATLNNLRSELKESGGQFTVVKNTLLRLALEEAGVEGMEPYLRGPTAVVWAKGDPVAPAKVIKGFEQKLESFQIKGGVVDGALVDSEQVRTYAEMPSREELIAKLLSLINAPATQLLQMMNAPAQSLLSQLAQLKEKLEEAEK